jgi:hypothetical protein
MADGSQQAIGTLKPGMLVSAWNEHTREYSTQEIEEVHVIENRLIIKVTVVDTDGNQADEIFTTSDHPFFVEGKGWVKVDALEAGDQFISANDDASGALFVKSITQEGYAATAYNLTVANAHTFFVGDHSVWVHNQSSHDFFFGQTRISQTFQSVNSDAPDWIRGQTVDQVAQTMLNDPSKRLNIEYFTDSQGRKIVTNNRALAAYTKAGILPPADSVVERQPTQAELNRLNEFPDGQPRRTVDITIGKNNPTLLDRVDAGAFPCR